MCAFVRVMLEPLQTWWCSIVSSSEPARHFSPALPAEDCLCTVALFLKGWCLVVGRHSKQGSVIPLTIIDGPADWKSADLKANKDEYTYTLSKSDVNEFVSAVEKVKAKGIASEDDVANLRF